MNTTTVTYSSATMATRDRKPEQPCFGASMKVKSTEEAWMTSAAKFVVDLDDSDDEMGGRGPLMQRFLSAFKRKTQAEESLPLKKRKIAKN